MKSALATPAEVPWSAAVRTAVEDRLFQALAVLRVVLLANTIMLNVLRRDGFARPELGVGILLAMVGWTAFATYAYSVPSRRTVWLLVADLALTVGAIAASLPAKGDLHSTVPGFWVMAALLAWSAHYGWRGGMVAAIVIVSADIGVRSVITQSNYGNIFLLMIGGPIVGFVSDSLKRMAWERDLAERAAAAAAERQRLARAVHDGVLQVLALVQRKGRQMGGEFGELAELAGQQEAALRTLIRQQDSVALTASEDVVMGTKDLKAALEQLESLPNPRVGVSGPAGSVELPGALTDELVLAVRECLTNIAHHVGEHAPAWVLLEAFPDRVVVSIRDEGSGIPEGRLAVAEGEGRLGVTQSIRQRIHELGGQARLMTGPTGTEWELSVPIGPRGAAVDIESSS